MRTLRRMLVIAWSVAIVVVGQAAADEQARQAATAEDKAATLEHQAAEEGAGKSSAPPAEVISRTEVQAVDPAGKEPLDDAITCLARTIYWEAKGEDADGMAAIAEVVVNRLGHAGFPRSVCGVVKQGREQGECQFSWWCDGRPDDVEEEKRYAVAKEIARKALNRQLAEKTGGALYFHHRKVSPAWAGKYRKTAEVGEHRFYKPADGSAK